MKYTSEDYKDYLVKLEEINELDWVKNYLQLKEKPNFWTIIEYGQGESSNDKSAHETRMSKMIRWMMDPDENHGLGNVFAYKIIEWMGGDYVYGLEEDREIKTIAEYHSNGRYIDVLYKDFTQKTSLAIELKQYAKEDIDEDGVSQLDEYQVIVEKIREEKDLQPYYIFLTPLGDAPSNTDWQAMGYQNLIDIIDGVNRDYIPNSSSAYREDSQKIILDFRDELQRTLDICKKDNSVINKKLTDKKKNLTSILAKEILEGVTSEHIDKLLEINEDRDLDIKELIFLVKDHLHLQDHTPNDEIKLLIRKIYNYLSGDKKLDTDGIRKYSVEETKTELKPHLLESGEIKFMKIELTSRQQGISIYNEDRSYRVYMSGDTHGSFPNAGVQLLAHPKDGSKINSEILKPGSFQIKDGSILEDKIYDKSGNLIDLDKLIEDYVIPAIKELSENLSIHL